MTGYLVVTFPGLLSTPNLIQLPQQSPGGILTTPPHLGLQAQVKKEPSLPSLLTLGAPDLMSLAAVLISLKPKAHKPKKKKELELITGKYKKKRKYF